MKRFLFLYLLLLLSSAILAQPSEISLVVTGEGIDKTEATNNALKSAVEQAYGAFVSANTDILNDEVISDEIVTITQGNIHEYKELSNLLLPDNTRSVTLQVKVSIQKLVNYAKSKGASCEFAGAVFGANKRLYDFNVKSTKKALENFYAQLEYMVADMYDAEVMVGEPHVEGSGIARLDMALILKSNKNTDIVSEFIRNTLMSISFSYDEIAGLKDQGYKFYPYNIFTSSPRKNIDKMKVDNTHARWKDGVKTVRYFYAEIDELAFNAIMEKSISCFKIKDNTGSIYYPYLPNSYYTDNEREKISTRYYKLFQNREIEDVEFFKTFAGNTSWNFTWHGSPVIRIAGVTVCTLDKIPEGTIMYKMESEQEMQLNSLEQISSFASYKDYNISVAQSVTSLK